MYYIMFWPCPKFLYYNLNANNANSCIIGQVREIEKAFRESLISTIKRNPSMYLDNLKKTIIIMLYFLSFASVVAMAWLT